MARKKKAEAPEQMRPAASFRVMAAMKDGRSLYLLRTRSLYRERHAIDGKGDVPLTAKRRFSEPADSLEADRLASHLNGLLGDGTSRPHLAQVAYFYVATVEQR